MTSAVPQVIAWLVAAAGASPLLGSSPTAPVQVIDGPSVTGDELAAPLHLWVGCSDPQESDVSAAGATQVWPVLDHGRTRQESGEVWLTADAWSGGTGMGVVRAQCAAIVAGVEVLLRGLPRDGGPGDMTMGGLVWQSAVDGPFTWSQRQASDGAGCSCSFRVAYQTRLLTAT